MRRQEYRGGKKEKQSQLEGMKGDFLGYSRVLVNTVDAASKGYIPAHSCTEGTLSKRKKKGFTYPKTLTHTVIECRDDPY